MDARPLAARSPTAALRYRSWKGGAGASRSCAHGPPQPGRKLAADPAVNSDSIAYPQGYGIEAYQRGTEPPSDSRLIELACKDVSKALPERSTVLDESTDELRKLMAERLERLFFGVYRSAIRTGDLAAVDRAVRIIERSSHLLGLNRPVRTEITGADGGAVLVDTTGLDELERLIALRLRSSSCPHASRVAPP
ncbi:hypothetical protein AB0892_06670 [Streptomyces sp. NPDC005409]|uniref:hypothetical protein n=1 Tax=Streptomyces sp. NPDC005409 TaxID=3155342 RepID=UPI00345267C5